MKNLLKIFILSTLFNFQVLAIEADECFIQGDNLATNFSTKVENIMGGYTGVDSEGSSCFIALTPSIGGEIPYGMMGDISSIFINIEISDLNSLDNKKTISYNCIGTDAQENSELEKELINKNSVVSLETFGLKDKTKLNLYFDIRGRLEGYQTVVTKKSMLGIKYPYQKSCEGLQKVSDYYGNDL